MSIVTVLSAILTTLALTLAPLPAGAATKTFKDARNDTKNSNNIVRYTVKNGKRIGVTTKHKNLTKKAVDIQFWVKKKGSSHYFLVYSGTDGGSQAVYNDKFVNQRCSSIKLKRNLKKDTLSLSVPRKCVGSPKGKVRVKVRVQWTASGKGDTAGYSRLVRR